MEEERLPSNVQQVNEEAKQWGHRLGKWQYGDEHPDGRWNNKCQKQGCDATARMNRYGFAVGRVFNTWCSGK